jgi:hypothetical protein
MALFFFERCVGVMVTQFSLSMPLCEIIMVTAFGNNMVLHPFLTCMWLDEYFSDGLVIEE